MLAVTRHRVPEPEAAHFLDAARRALDVLAQRPGFFAGRIGRAADDGELWVITSEWVDVGSYRRALSAYDVKVEAIPLLSTADRRADGLRGVDRGRRERHPIGHLGPCGRRRRGRPWVAANHRADDVPDVALAAQGRGARCCWSWCRS